MKKALTLFILFVITFSPVGSFAQSIASYFVVHSYDVCGTYYGYIKTSGYTPGQTLKFYWGDGSNEIKPVAFWYADTGNTYFDHAFATPGAYTIKAVLYDGAPVDSVSFSQDVENCSFLLLGSAVDMNANCTKDAGDPWVYSSSTVEIDSAGFPIDTMSCYGYVWHRATGGPGTVYTFRVITPPVGLVLSCGSPGIIHDSISIPFDTTNHLKYFMYDCASSTSGFDLDIRASLRSSVFLGIYRANIWVTNTSCTGTPALLRYDFSPKFSFGSIEPAVSYTVTGNSVIADIGNVSEHGPALIRIHLNPLVTFALGDTVNSTFSVTPVTGDMVPANNNLVRCDTIGMSWDPNHKSVTPSGNILPGTALEYMLEFENTGSDTAHNIHIMDTLSAYLDFNSFRGGTSSHRTAVMKYSEGGYNIVKFDFPNIMLPDSSHHDVCHGMVTFSIKAKSTLASGTLIPNRAGIYFDANEVVMTNTAYSFIPWGLGVTNTKVSAVALYPNPVRDVLNISISGKSFSSVTIYNVIGQQVRTETIENMQAAINVSALPSGIYYAALRGKDGSNTIKFEKQ